MFLHESIRTCVTVCFSRLLMDSRKKVIHENTSCTFIFTSFLETLNARTMPYTGFECIGISICESTALLIELVSYCIVLYCNTQNQRQLLPNITEPSKPRSITHSLKRRLHSGFRGGGGGRKKVTLGLSLSLQTCYCIVKHTFLL